MKCINCKVVMNHKFCAHCGRKVPGSEFECVVTEYFRKGFTYVEILEFLRERHSVKISLRTLKSKLKEFNLRRKSYTRENLSRAIKIMIEELRSSGNAGYRTLWHHLRHEGFSVPRDLVMLTMREFDPEGVISRRANRLKRRQYQSRGPNYIWHADGYDKLKPFGFPIHGCIDGFSRKILWLRVVKSNNNPLTVASIYLDVVKEFGYFPYCVRTDCGSENNILAAAQCFFHRDNDNEMPHMFGSSHHNQRIEAWWSQFRRLKSNAIINMFKDLVNSGLYNCGSEFERAVARYCFGPLIQSELDACKEEWNCHYIRKSEYSAINGRPDYLYFFPGRNYSDKQSPIVLEDVTVINDYVSDSSENEEDDGVFMEYCDNIFQELNLPPCNDFDNAKANFLRILDLQS